MTADGPPRRATVGSPGVLVVAAVVVAGIAVGAMSMAGSGHPTADEVLTDARERYGSAETIAGTAVVTIEAGNVTRTAEVQFAVTDDNDSRVAVTARNRTVVAGTNGSVGWLHLPGTGLTRVVDVSGGELAENAAGDYAPNASHWNRSRWNASEWLPGERNGTHRSGPRALSRAWTPENATAERVGTGTVGDTEVHVIEVTPAGDRNGTVRIWIGTERSTVLRTRFAAGNATVTVRFTDVRFDVSIADSTFRPPGIGPPTTTTTVDSRGELRTATGFPLPRPSGTDYRFVAGSTVRYGNATAAIQRYAGPANATLVTTTAERLPGGVGGVTDADAETVELGNTTADVVEAEGRVIVSWSRDGLRHAVVFEGPRETAIELAESAVGTAGDP